MLLNGIKYLSTKKSNVISTLRDSISLSVISRVLFCPRKVCHECHVKALTFDRYDDRLMERLGAHAFISYFFL